MTIASNALQMIQFAVAAGKRMVVCGVLFFDSAHSVAYYGGSPYFQTVDQSKGLFAGSSPPIQPSGALQASKGSLRSRLRLPGESRTTCRRVGQHPGWCASHRGLQSCRQRLPRGIHHFPSVSEVRSARVAYVGRARQHTVTTVEPVSHSICARRHVYAAILPVIINL